MRRFLIRTEIDLRRYARLTKTGDRFADAVYISLRWLPDLTRDEIAFLLGLRRQTVDGALEVLNRRRLVASREVFWRA